jgi:hypothetical protein
MRLDLVMLIIDREFRRRETRGVGKVGREWAVGGKRQGPGEMEQGIRCRTPKPRVRLGVPHRQVGPSPTLCCWPELIKDPTTVNFWKPGNTFFHCFVDLVVRSFF